MIYSKIEYALKHNRFLQTIYVFLGSLFFKIIGLFIRPKKNLILFQSMIGRTFEDSPKIIYERLISDDFFNNYIFYWAFLEPDNFVLPRGKKIKINSFQYFIVALKCGVWIGNSGIERGLHFKHKKTVFINTGHGAAVKFIGNAVKGRHDFNFKDVDLFCTVSEMDKEIRIRDMGVKPEALRLIGYPINDFLYSISNSKIVELRKKYKIPDGKKVICYAPTWRESKDRGETYVIKPPIDLEKWKKSLGDEYVLLFRAHHLTTKVLNVQYDDFLLDGSSKYPSNEILAISDVLISDYSSILLDFTILERPILAFVYDYDEYVKERGLYITPYDFIPDSTFKNEDEILNKIKNMNYVRESNVSKKVKEKYMMGEGKATDICIEYLKTELKRRYK